MPYLASLLRYSDLLAKNSIFFQHFHADCPFHLVPSLVGPFSNLRKSFTDPETKVLQRADNKFEYLYIVVQ